MALCISPVSFGMIRQPCHGLMESSYHRFFLLLDRGAKPGSTWWCLSTERNWSLYELCLLVKWNNPQILFFHMQNEIVSEIQLSLGLHSEVTVPRSPRGFMHSTACGLTYDFFDIFFSGIIINIFIKKCLVAESRCWCHVCVCSLSLWAENFIHTMCAAPR